MSDPGQMPTRLARSYREDDLRRSADSRLRQAMKTGGSGSTASSGERSWASVRTTLAAIRRLVPRVA
jgi:hypothetical protein